MKKVVKNKFGIFETIEDDCNCGCKDCKEPIVEEIIIDETPSFIDEEE